MKFNKKIILISLNLLFFVYFIYTLLVAVLGRSYEMATPPKCDIVTYTSFLYIVFFAIVLFIIRFFIYIIFKIRKANESERLLFWINIFKIGYLVITLLIIFLSYICSSFA